MVSAPPLHMVGGMSYPAVKVYWLEETDEWVCYGLGMSRGRCRARPGLHCRASYEVARGTGIYPEKWPDYRRRGDDTVLRCEMCARVIVLPVISGSMGMLYRDTRNGALVDLIDAEPGAMWDAKWIGNGVDRGYTGPDGIALCVKCPNGHDWMVDSQASNCTRPQRAEGTGAFVRSHYCWVRHGDPRTGMVHVDKNGNTCAAGAGSIVAGDYHGFLHNGWLTAG